MAGDQRAILLGKLALERGLITADQLAQALADQERDARAGPQAARSLADILIDSRFLTGIR
jgi:hypothetical protein